MASIYSVRYKSRATGNETVTWKVGYYQDGKHRSVSAGKSKTVAQKLKRQIEAELQSGKFDFLSRPENIRVDQSVQAFLEHIQALRKPKTAWRYRNALEHLQEFLEAKYASVSSVSRLTKGHFEDYKGWRRSTRITANGRAKGNQKTPTFKTINVELSVFRSWINWAITMGHARDNPLQGLKTLKTTDSKPRRSLTRDEYADLVAASMGIEEANPSRQGQTDLWRFLANTGMRIGEVVHLEWGDIDFRREVIKVQRKPDWDPKTYEREIPFTPESANVLQALRETRPSKDGLIFMFRTGKPLRENTIRVWLLECAEKAGIKGMRGPHDLRHTFITMALTEFGIDIPSVQKMAGHRNLETTQLYLHPTTDHIRSAAKRFDL